MLSLNRILISFLNETNSEANSAYGNVQRWIFIRKVKERWNLQIFPHSPPKKKAWMETAIWKALYLKSPSVKDLHHSILARSRNKRTRTWSHQANKGEHRLGEHPHQMGLRDGSGYIKMSL